jgi:hypothetical protein
VIVYPDASTPTIDDSVTFNTNCGQAIYPGEFIIPNRVYLTGVTSSGVNQVRALSLSISLTSFLSFIISLFPFSLLQLLPLASFYNQLACSIYCSLDFSFLHIF